MALIESVKKTAGASALASHDAAITGTEGLFSAIEDRGNIAYNALGSTHADANTYTLPEFDDIL